MKRALVLLAAAAGWVTGCGLAFSVLQHTGTVAGLYWAVATATGTGYGDVHAHGTGGQLLAIAAMLTCIPLAGSAGALLAGAHAGRRAREYVDQRLGEHHRAIHERLDRIEGNTAPPGGADGEGQP